MLERLVDAVLAEIAAQPYYIVEIQPGCWLAPWKGDPGRTLVESSARRFGSRHGAAVALGIAQQCQHQRVAVDDAGTR